MMIRTIFYYNWDFKATDCLYIFDNIVKLFVVTDNNEVALTNDSLIKRLFKRNNHSIKKSSVKLLYYYCETFEFWWIQIVFLNFEAFGLKYP